MSTLLAYPKFKATDSNGKPVSSGKLYSYEPGSSTAKSTYTTSALSTANANPTILNTSGEATIWLSGKYKFVLKDANDVEIWSLDNVEGMEQATGVEQTLTYGATIATDVNDGNVCFITVTNSTDFTISNPTNTTNGRTLTYIIYNNSGGDAGDITWGNNFIYNDKYKGPPANGMYRVVTWIVRQAKLYLVSDEIDL